MFTQLNQDKDILEKIKVALNSENNIDTIIQKSNNKEKNKIVFSSIDLCNDLSKLGGIKNKSLTLEFPNSDIVPNELIHHFIRGYFDGDGCVWNGKRKKMIVKDLSTSSGTREKIVHNVKFTFTGSIYFINSLQDLLIKEGIVHRKTKLNTSKRKIGNEPWATMEYSGRKQMKNLFNFMYKNATIYGNRKYNKFLEIFCASEEKSLEDTSLIAGTPEMEISSQASLEEGSSTIPEMGVESSDSKYEAPNT